MANSLNNQGVRTPPSGGVGRSVHTFRRELFVKFRKSPHRTEKALRHAQKPANLRSTNPIGPESTSVTPGEDPPIGNPPPGPKNDVGETLSRPSRPLLRLAKVTQKRGFSRLFPAVFRGFPGFRFSGGFLGKFDGGWTTVFRQHASPGSTPSRLRHPPSSERNCRQFRTQFQAYKPSIAAFRKCVCDKETCQTGGNE